MNRGAVAVLLVALAATAVAQPVAPSKSGMVTYFDGKVFVNGETLTDPIVAQFPYVKENNTLSTEAGRVEVLMNPGVTVRLGESASLKMITNRFSDTRVDLTAGSAVVDILEIQKDNAFTMAAGEALISFPKAGSYHVDTNPARVKVFAGVASVSINGKTVEVDGGKLMNFSGDLALAKFNKEDTDSLDRWAIERGEMAAIANRSSAKRSADLGKSGGTMRDCYVSQNAVSTRNPCAGSWTWNPWFGAYTYIPFHRICTWSGYCYEDPSSVISHYYAPRVIYPPSTPGNGGWANMPSAPTSSSGYSGASTAAAAAAASSTSSGATSGSSAAAAAASSASQGSGSSGGRSR